jgi:deoxyribose-phosphate aldolase
MEFTTGTLSRQMIITAVMPFDDVTTVDKLLTYSDSCHGVAFLPSFIHLARATITNENREKLIGLVGYPTGGVSTKTKVNEVRDMVYEGAGVIYVVANTGYILSGNWEDIHCELLSLQDSANQRPVCVIMEAAYLSDHQIMRLINLCADVGINSIGTNSGWLPLNPDAEQVQRIKEMVHGRMQIIVAGVVNLDQARQYLEAGADYIIIRQQHAEAIFSQLA